VLLLMLFLLLMTTFFVFEVCVSAVFDVLVTESLWLLIF